MTTFKARLWRDVGVAALAGIGAAACTPSGETDPANSAPAAVVGEAGEAGEAGGGEGGEAGEAGAADAYAGIEGDARTIVRLQHLEGFLLLAQSLVSNGDSSGAAILTQQGLLEVADPALSAFSGIDLAPLRAAAAGEDAAKLRPALRAALAALDARQDALGGASTETVRRMLALTRGLYAATIVDGAVDPTEYQHSLGAALAAADALDEASRGLTGEDAQRAKAAASEMRALLALWPELTAPAAPTPVGEVIAQTSRVELALPRGEATSPTPPR